MYGCARIGETCRCSSTVGSGNLELVDTYAMPHTRETILLLDMLLESGTCVVPYDMSIKRVPESDQGVPIAQRRESSLPPSITDLPMSGWEVVTVAVELVPFFASCNNTDGYVAWPLSPQLPRRQ